MNFRYVTAFAVFGLLGSAGLSYGQSQPAPSAPAPAASASSPAQTPPPARVKQFDDWFYRCVDVPFEGKTVSSCEVAQLRQVKNGQETVTVLTLAIAQTAPQDGKGDKPGLLLTAVTPLNVYLPDGLIFSVDGKPAGKVNYRNCNQSGCWAQLRLDGDFLTSLRKGSEAEVRFRLVNGRNVNVGASLKGLTAALNGLEKGELR